MFISAKRCTMDMNNCEDFNKITIPGICNRFKDKNLMWSELTSQFVPPLKCPLQTVSDRAFYEE